MVLIVSVSECIPHIHGGGDEERADGVSASEFMPSHIDGGGDEEKADGVSVREHIPHIYTVVAMRSEQMA